MMAITIRSEEARNGWRNMIDAVLGGGSVIIERWRKPVAVLVPYDRWQAMQRQHADLFRERVAESNANDVSLEEAIAGLIERGKLPSDFLQTSGLTDVTE